MCRLSWARQTERLRAISAAPERGPHRHLVPPRCDRSQGRRHVYARELRPPIPGGDVEGRWFGDDAAECVVGAALARTSGNHHRVRRWKCMPASAPCSFASSASLRPAVRRTTPCWRRSPRRSNSRSSRAISPLAGERADQTRRRFFAAEPFVDDAGGIRELVLLAVHFVDLAPAAGTIAGRGGAADPPDRRRRRAHS